MTRMEFKKNSKPKISDFKTPISTLNEKPLLSFKYYRKNDVYCLIKVTELKIFTEKLIDFSLLTWSQINISHWLQFKKISNSTRNLPALPDWLSNDIDIFEFRVSQTARVFWIRDKWTFHLLWFDENHRICP